MKETLKAVADGVRVRSVDDERGTVAYTLQYRVYDRWYDAIGNSTKLFYNVPPTAKPEH